MAYHVERGRGIDGSGDGIVHQNIVASYTHIHALATPQWAPAMVRKAREYGRSRQRAGKEG
jgi:cobyrinic acid a,c-diamide synthase